MTERYSGALRALHWTMALLMVAALISGFLMLRVEAGPLQNRLFDLHRSFGVTILALVPIRLIVRYASLRPGPVSGLTPMQTLAAHAVHTALYLAFLVQPILGWIGSQAFGAPITVFGLVQMPMLVAKDEALAKLTLGLHNLAVWGILGLILLHVGAALHHQFVRKDGLIRRMV